MPRQPRSDVAGLLQEARALEILADEVEVEPARLQEYWSLSTDLITAVADIEATQTNQPDMGFDDPELLALRRRLRNIASRLAQLSPD